MLSAHQSVGEEEDPFESVPTQSMTLAASDAPAALCLDAVVVLVVGVTHSGLTRSKSGEATTSDRIGGIAF